MSDTLIKDMESKNIASGMICQKINKDRLESDSKRFDEFMHDFAPAGVLDIMETKSCDISAIKDVGSSLGLCTILLKTLGVSKIALLRSAALKFLILEALAAGDDSLQTIYNDLEEVAVLVKKGLAND